jgi:uracil-DNA glycosylase
MTEQKVIKLNITPQKTLIHCIEPQKVIRISLSQYYHGVKNKVLTQVRREQQPQKSPILTPKITLNIQSNDTKVDVKPQIKVDQTWSIERIAEEQPPKFWERVFTQDAKHELKDISNYILKEEKTNGIMSFPLRKDVFKAFEFFTPQETKVIIIGQDPYPGVTNSGHPVAQGMSFSAHRDAPIPASLKNIYKLLEKTIPNFKYPVHGDLTSWVKQGVLLLNSCLTVNPGQPRSHKKVWLGFVRRIINFISEFNRETIVVMWGAKAQEISKHLPDRFIKITGGHPSPTSVNTGGDFMNGDYFNECNKYLLKQGKIPIDWTIT